MLTGTFLAGWDFDSVAIDARSHSSNWGTEAATLSFDHAGINIPIRFTPDYGISTAYNSAIVGNDFVLGADSITGHTSFSGNDLPGTAKQGVNFTGPGTVSINWSNALDASGGSITYASLNSGVWSSVTDTLAAGATSYSFAANGFAIDNVQITGTVVPEPDPEFYFAGWDFDDGDQYTTNSEQIIFSNWGNLNASISWYQEINPDPPYDFPVVFSPAYNSTNVLNEFPFGDDSITGYQEFDGNDLLSTVKNGIEFREATLVTISWDRAISGYLEYASSTDGGASWISNKLAVTNSDSINLNIGSPTIALDNIALYTYASANNAPVISLNGESSINVSYGSDFIDPGATAFDLEDNQEHVVIISGDVDTNSLGTYTLTYTATDSMGASSSITRSVSVIAPDIPIIQLDDLYALNPNEEKVIQPLSNEIKDFYSYQWKLNGIDMPSIFGGNASQFTIYGQDFYIGEWSVEIFNNEGGSTQATFDVLTKRDSDSDGLFDHLETNTGIYNSENDTGTDPNNADTDNDQLLDGDEVLNYNTSPLINDSDLDGIDDYEEIFTYNTNPLSSDTDGDGLSDNEEINFHQTDPNKSDSDDDLLDDQAELSSYLTDPNNADTDNDQLLDGDEVLNYNTDPLNEDSDGDRLNDGFEINNSFTDPNLIDTDQDGYSDKMEYDLTNYFNPNIHTDISLSEYNFYNESELIDVKLGDVLIRINEEGAATIIEFDMEESHDLSTWNKTDSIQIPINTSDTDKKFIRFSLTK